MHTWLTALLLLFATTSPKSVAQTCSNIDQRLSPSRRSQFAGLIAIQTGVSAKNISIQRFMSSGSWALVFARPHGQERGIFFFEMEHGAPAYRNVWGGVLGDDPESSLVDWAHTLSSKFPQSLAACFAHAVAAGS